MMGQQLLWTDLDQHAVSLSKEPSLQPKNYRALSLNLPEMRHLLSQAPMEFQSSTHSLEVSLPTPDGGWERFQIHESPVMPDLLAAKFPLIQTYRGSSLDTPGNIVRLDVTTKGFHAMIFRPEGMVVIEPANPRTTGEYISYRSAELPPSAQQLENWCGTLNAEATISEDTKPAARMTGAFIRNFRLALVADFRYTNYHGGTNGAMSAMVTILNQVNAVIERDFAIRLTLIPNNDTLIISSNADDPFSDPGNVSPQILFENNTFLEQRIGLNNFDIGHLFTRRSDGALGIASLMSICTSVKGRGCSGGQPPIGSAFFHTVAHEIGHQLGSPHTFNSVTGGCFDNRSNNSAYEPGSGSTIMSYPGLCAPQNLQFAPNEYYHNASIQFVFDVVQSRNCGDTIPLNNQEPSVSAGASGMFIPQSTPFELIGNGSDPDGDALTYCWEQFDLGPAGHPNIPVGNAPLFRSFSPVGTPSRTFPSLSDIINNTQTRGEILPNYQRDMTFRLTVRDNHGGVNWDEMEMHVWETAGPFLVTEPNTSSMVWLTQTPQSIRWDVANTDAQPVNCQTVDLLLSLDGGLTYPTVLASDVPNNGLSTIMVPNTPSQTCRIRVQAHDNVFFDISNEDFVIEAPTSPSFDIYLRDQRLAVCEDGQSSIPIVSTSLLGFNNPITFNFGAGLPAGVNLSVQPTPMMVDDTAELVITTSSAAVAGIYQITFVASASGAPGVPQTIDIEISNEFPQILSQSSPPNGAAGTTYGHVFGWQADPAASSYRFELATSPAFDSTTLISKTGLQDPGYILQISLDTTATYYWRARAENVCGNGPYFPINGLQTGECLADTSADVPQVIPVFGSTREALSELEVTLPGNVSDIRIVDLIGSHDALEEITVSLISPSSTETILFSGICANQGNDFHLNFDDDSWESMINCPPFQGEYFRPQDELSSFIGEPATGTWTLKIVDNANFMGGELLAWGLEICTDGGSTPELITNQPLSTVQWHLDTIPSLLLEATDAVSGPTDLIFTLVEPPLHGGVLLNGQSLLAGQTFTQEDINLNQLTYLNNGDAVLADHFRFDVANADGGWIGVFDFDIAITLGPTAIGDLQDLLQVHVYPNPVQTDLFIELEGQWTGEVDLRLSNMQGQLLHQTATNKHQAVLAEKIHVQPLASGIYLLEIRTEQGALWEKVLIK